MLNQEVINHDSHTHPRHSPTARPNSPGSAISRRSSAMVFHHIKPSLNQEFSSSSTSSPELQTYLCLTKTQEKLFLPHMTAYSTHSTKVVRNTGQTVSCL